MKGIPAMHKKKTAHQESPEPKQTLALERGEPRKKGHPRGGRCEKKASRRNRGHWVLSIFPSLDKRNMGGKALNEKTPGEEGREHLPTAVWATTKERDGNEHRGRGKKS